MVKWLEHQLCMVVVELTKPILTLKLYNKLVLYIYYTIVVINEGV